MLENRSFDHMLGFMNHPLIPPLTPGSHINRVRPSDPSSPGKGVTPDAGHALVVDPPHSHLSIMKSLGRRRASNGNPRYSMDGFVQACFEKAACRELVPIIHWWRVEALFASIAGAVAIASAALASETLSVAAATILLMGTGLVLYLSRRPQYRCTGPADAEAAAFEVMRCQPENQVPVLVTLAREFAVCRNWFSSVPGETWPNRNFAHAATSEGTTGIEPGFFNAPTIFHRLEEAKRDWRIYYDGVPQAMVFDDLWSEGRIRNWFPFDRFFDHVAKDDLPTYSFIEPRHQGPLSNSQHPGNNRELGPDGRYDFQRGEQLITDIYEQLRRFPAVFEKSLLLITYDEHGGLFDHVSPPTTVSPSAPKSTISLTRRLVRVFVTFRSARFDFKRLGVRVPTVLVSPWIKRLTVAEEEFDHSSIVATVRRLFAPHSKVLTSRDAGANTFEGIPSLDEPRRGSDLPDMPPPAPALPAAETSRPPPTSDEEDADLFSTQLDALARKAAAELDRRGVPPVEEYAEALARAEADGVPHADMLARFQAQADRARGNSDS
jgi:phospholipase C